MITLSLSGRRPGIAKPCLPFQTRWLLFVSSFGLLLFCVGRLLKLMSSKFHAHFSSVLWIRSHSPHDQDDIWIKSSSDNCQKIPSRNFNIYSNCDQHDN